MSTETPIDQSAPSAPEAEKKPEAAPIHQEVFLDDMAPPSPLTITPTVEIPATDIPPVVQKPVEEVQAATSITPEMTDSVVTVRNPQNLILDDAISTTLDTKDEAEISLPGDTSAKIEEIVTNMPNITVGETVRGDRWATSVRTSILMNSYQDTFLSVLEGKDASWRQNVEFGGTKFAGHLAPFKEKKNAIFDGDIAVLRTLNHLGMGSAFNVPLWNTGIWLTLKPPAEEDLVELYRQLTSDQIQHGRNSYGLVYANTSAYTIERLCQFVVRHIYRINGNPEKIGPGNILDYIKAQDITSLLWGMACTMFTSGFKYNRACINDPAKCQNVVTELLNVHKLQVVNRAALTERQKSHMSEHRTQIKIGPDELKSYESEMLKAKTYRIDIYKDTDREISIILRSPSINEYIQTGHRWIDDMVNSVDVAFGQIGIDADATYELRNSEIEKRARATIMRQYCHWVDHIELGEGNRIEDKVTIEKVLNQISADQTIRETFLTEVKKFIENSSVSVVGIPVYNCPVCNKVNDGPESFPHKDTMIPIDVIQLFFVLVTQKHAELVNR